MIERVSYKLVLLGATGAQFCWNSLRRPVACTSELSTGGFEGAGSPLDSISHQSKVDP